MVQFFHPSIEDITLSGVLSALGDPARLQIVRNLYGCREGASCSKASPSVQMAKSTLTGHYRVLRDAGLIRTSKRGVEHVNVLRLDELESRFPGLVPSIIAMAMGDPKPREA